MDQIFSTSIFGVVIGSIVMALKLVVDVKKGKREEVVKE